MLNKSEFNLLTFEPHIPLNFLEFPEKNEYKNVKIKKIKICPHFPQLPSCSWQSFDKKFQLLPLITARGKKVVVNSYDHNNQIY